MIKKGDEGIKKRSRHEKAGITQIHTHTHTHTHGEREKPTQPHSQRDSLKKPRFNLEQMSQTFVSQMRAAFNMTTHLNRVHSPNENNF